MAIYRLAISAIQRSKGRSATAAAAYRSAERITDHRTGQSHDYRKRKNGVRHTALIGWTGSRASLWNEAEIAERRSNSIVAREVQIALPAELPDTERWVLSLALANWIQTRYGVAVDVALHTPRKGDNFHAHLLFTTRTVTGDQFGAKTRQLDVKATASVEVEQMREVWARLCNTVLAEQGQAERIDHRSYARQGREQESEHVPRPALAQEQRGERTVTGDGARAARRRNRARAARAAARRQGRTPTPASVIRQRADQTEQPIRQAPENRARRLLERLEGAEAVPTPQNAPEGQPEAPTSENPRRAASGPRR